MAERVDYVTVALTDGDVPLLWEVRQQLMARLEHVESTGRIRASFAAVGASGRRIELTWGEKAALLAALADWASQPGRLRGDAFPALHASEPVDRGVGQRRRLEA